MLYEFRVGFETNEKYPSVMLLHVSDLVHKFFEERGEKVKTISLIPQAQIRDREVGRCGARYDETREKLKKEMYELADQISEARWSRAFSSDVVRLAHIVNMLKEEDDVLRSV